MEDLRIIRTKLNEDVNTFLKYSDITHSEHLALITALKLIENAKAIELLAGANLINEGLVILRLVFEHVTNIFALLKSEEYLQKFIDAANTHHRKVSLELDKSIKKTNTKIESQGPYNQFEEMIGEIQSSPIEKLNLSIFEVAHSHQIGELYDHYRKLSLFHAHSNYLSITTLCKKENLDELLEGTIAYLNIITVKLQNRFKRT